MATTTPSRRERAAAVSDGLFAPLATRELLSGLGDVVHKKVPLTSIEPNPGQPRQGVDETSGEFQDLVGSIRQQGLIQPISLWQLDEDEERYLLIAGERRWRAFRRLAEDNPSEFARIPATVTVLDGDKPEARALMMGLIENVVREDLKDGERANALARLKDSTGWTYEQIAERMGMGVSRVVALASIARHEPVRAAVDSGEITQKQAILIGQGVRDSQLAGELVPAVKSLDERTTRAVIKIARQSRPGLSPRSRVLAAVDAVSRAVAVLEASPRLTARGAESVIVLNKTSLRTVRPALSEMDRPEFEAMLQRVCEETGVWPSRPATPVSSVAEMGSHGTTVQPPA